MLKIPTLCAVLCVLATVSAPLEAQTCPDYGGTPDLSVCQFEDLCVATDIPIGNPFNPSGYYPGVDPVAEQLAMVFGWQIYNAAPLPAEPAEPQPGDELVGALNWDMATGCRPKFAQNLYRYQPPVTSVSGGRFEQIGMSWLKRGFSTGPADSCAGECNPWGPTHPSNVVGPNCSDAYSTFFNRTGLGPRYAVNPYTGEEPPFTPPPNDIFPHGLMAVDFSDGPASADSDWEFYIEHQGISSDDAANQGDTTNNSMYTNLLPDFDLVFSGCVDGSLLCGLCDFPSSPYNSYDMFNETVTVGSAIQAWKANDPAVSIQQVEVPCDGSFLIAHKVTTISHGVYEYEYAIFNRDSERAARGFIVPVAVGAIVDSIGFHDVDYHSGDPIDGTDWIGTRGLNAVSWETVDDYSTNPNANAIRWGTLYNFRFRSNARPKQVTATLRPFKFGAPGPCSTSAIPVTVLGPGKK